MLAPAELTAETVAALLRPYGFSEPARADRLVQALAETHPSREQFASILPNLLRAAGQSPDPDEALLRFHAYACARTDPHTFFEMLVAVPGLLDDLMRVFGSSEYLSAILTRNPHYLTWLLETQAQDRVKSRDEMESELRAWAGIFHSFESRLGILRRFKRRETLRIGMRDLLGVAGVEETTRELAHLADAAFRVAYELVRPAVEARYGAPQHPDGAPASFAVIGMGKLGGEELNFSSDVDVLFVYSEDGQTAAGVENSVYFQRLGEQLIRAMGEPTDEGYVFRVDVRLRPQSRSGTLARSLDSYEGYYESWGELFDRQALLKARLVAGDADLGAEFLRRLHPFVYRHLDADALQDTLDEIGRTKATIERRIAQEGDPTLHVKLGPGGIRDVEFVAQAMQLVYGARSSRLRASGTLPVLTALRAAGPLRPEDADALADGYRFLRRVENFLQLVADRQLYSLPEDEEAWERHARRLGYTDTDGAPAGEQFRRDYRRHRESVRRVYETVFRPEREPASVALNLILDEETPDEGTVAFLRSFGLDDADTACRTLRGMARGSGRVRFTPRIRRAFLRFASALLERLRAVPDPMQALLQFDRFLSASGARAFIYPLLQEHPGVLQLLVRILGTSRFLGEVIVQDPLAFETLVYGAGVQRRVRSVADFRTRMAEQIAPDAKGVLKELQRFRLAELVRIGTRDILGESTPAETMEELSLLAESVVQFYAERVRADLIAEHGEPHHEDGTVATFAVIGMGKLGGREINYSSDLDVQFVYSGEGKTTGGMPNTQFFQRLARRIVSQLKVPTLGGSLYELDLRLRPHGRGGPVALAVDAYARYYAAHGELWERQALLRARQVAGDPTVGGRFVAMARAFAYRAPLTAEEITAIYRTRERKEDKAARETDRLHDLKSGYGGLVDIEFLVQMLQLHHGPTDSSLRTTNTREAIRALYEAGHLRGAAASWLLDTYMFLRFVEDRLHIVDNRTLTALPEDDAGMEKLARRLGYVASNGETARERFLLEYHERTRAVRAIFEDVFEDARAGAA